MERIGKLEKYGEDGRFCVNDCVETVIDDVEEAKADKFIAAAALYNSLIRPAGLERSGKMVEVAGCLFNHWYFMHTWHGQCWCTPTFWLNGKKWGEIAGLGFATVTSAGQLIVRCKTNTEEVELPRTAEEKSMAHDDVPGLNPPESQKTPMELLEERMMLVEKRLKEITNES